MTRKMENDGKILFQYYITLEEKKQHKDISDNRHLQQTKVLTIAMR